MMHLNMNPFQLKANRYVCSLPAIFSFSLSFPFIFL